MLIITKILNAPIKMLFEAYRQCFLAVCLVVNAWEKIQISTAIRLNAWEEVGANILEGGIKDRSCWKYENIPQSALNPLFELVDVGKTFWSTFWFQILLWLALLKCVPSFPFYHDCENEIDQIKMIWQFSLISQWKFNIILYKSNSSYWTWTVV